MIPFDFEFTSLPNTVYFGEGKVDLLPQITKGYHKIFAISEQRTAHLVSALIEQLGEDKVFPYYEVIQHVPDSLVKKTKAEFDAFQPDLLLAIGGGSSIGLAKMLAKESGTPILAVPTTYAGSEMTNIWGTTTDEGKITGRDDKVLPRYVIYDPNLTATMPVGLAATSAMNAMAHLMEAVYAQDNNPVTYQNSLVGIQHLKKGMQLIAKTKELTREANKSILLGAYLAGKGLCEVPMALHHKAAHTLGGSFGVEHSQGHTIMQAYVLQYQWEYLPSTVKEDFIKVFESDYPPKALKSLASGMGAPLTLKEIGFKENDIEKAAKIMAERPYPNPAPLTPEGLTKLMRNAFEGNV